MRMAQININNKFIFDMPGITTINRFRNLLSQYERQSQGTIFTRQQIIYAIFQSLETQLLFAKYVECISAYCNEIRCKILNGSKLAGFKFVVLVHKIVLNVEWDYLVGKTLGLKVLPFVQNWIKSINIKSKFSSTKKKQLTNYFHQNLIMPYIFYIQKKLQFLQINVINNDAQMKPSNGISNKQATIELKQTPKTAANIKSAHSRPSTSCNSFLQALQGHYQLSYKHINLLNSGLKVSQKLMTLLRYYFSQEDSVVDFNIVLGEDFGSIYLKISQEVDSIKKIEADMGICSSEFVELERELERIHEVMYVVYMNQYTHRMLRRIQPKWIKTDTKIIRRHITQQPSISDTIYNNPEFSGQNLKNLDDQVQTYNRPRSRTAIMSMSKSWNYEESSQKSINTHQLTIKTQRTEKEEQKLKILEQLQLNFKKSISQNEFNSILFKKDKKTKKNRSFYEVKNLKN